MSVDGPRLASPSTNFFTRPAGGRLTHVKFGVNRTHKHGRSSVASGFEPGDLRLICDVSNSWIFLPWDWLASSDIGRRQATHPISDLACQADGKKINY
ncbi:hypothetical protein AVEN_97394-1 [Araneus ventricosus]|uniref:Uncharacterized protein n=1 Tax=Araneus ventricosus TaxID=182803 RepID=A0A4Y2MY79_ARAVE|nr:hypothetical protein AVEN_97394-1 [Araneus ventricosus]